MPSSPSLHSINHFSSKWTDCNGGRKCLFYYVLPINVPLKMKWPVLTAACYERNVWDIKPFNPLNPTSAYILSDFLIFESCNGKRSLLFGFCCNGTKKEFPTKKREKKGVLWSSSRSRDIKKKVKRSVLFCQAECLPAIATFPGSLGQYTMELKLF